MGSQEKGGVQKSSLDFVEWEPMKNDRVQVRKDEGCAKVPDKCVGWEKVCFIDGIPEEINF